MGRRYIFLKKITLFIVFFIVLIFALKEARSFLIPIMLAVLLAYMLFPLASFLERKWLPRILANLVAILFSIGVLVLAFNFISHQVSVFAEDLPDIQNQAETNWESIKRNLSESTGISKDRIDDWEKDVRSVYETSDAMLRSTFSTTTNIIVQTGLMPVYIFFLLYYRDKFHEVILQLSRDRREKTETILKEVNLVAKKYMTGLVIVVFILSILHTGAFLIIGIDYPVFFGVMAALFNFIPYFGTLIGAVLPLSYAFLAMDSLSYSFWVLIYFIVIQFVENNILTPNITGGYLSLNPFVTILSLILGSMLWGVAGMILIVPFVAMFKIFCDHVSFLKPIGYFLSDKGTEKYALSVEKMKGWFKK
ncbi:AI-2E family transporter [Litoribacter alkaliphilus]|uniref:AI-2E family transporter n=1 Tax=Litoribacter ruber TaxID=702568 RepID=A0AAP2CMG4_9BACT|nr:AI-2E family transporter [Litoribacter alkaliphilus]MBS9525255.1 AI-2E family transporter [Litoribacter alkaliphilus]